MLTLNDGRAELWQWDTGRTLSVDADCSQVHFSNKVFGRSIDVDAVDGVADIPDILLQTDNDLNVWAFVGTAENGYTKISKTFKVNRRNKPADYVFTPVEQTTIDEIAAIAQSVRDDADAGLFNGEPGDNGITPHIGDNGNWFLGAEDTGKPSRGVTGAKGDTGAAGPAGPQGPAGEPGKDGAGIDITGATVGQIAKIAAVDESGVPTAWSPADMPSGGSSDFIIHGAKYEDEQVVLDKTFAQIKEAVQAGKRAIVQMTSDGKVIIMPLIVNQSRLLMFSSLYNSDNSIFGISLMVTSSGVAEYFVSTPTNNLDGTMPQVNMAAAPTEAMQIATKKYVDDHAGGGTDMGITGATVGQIAKIAAVDASGVPTAWAPVDMPSGGTSGSGGETWELVAEATTTEVVNSMRVTFDACSAVYVEFCWGGVENDLGDIAIYPNQGDTPYAGEKRAAAAYVKSSASRKRGMLCVRMDCRVGTYWTAVSNQKSRGDGAFGSINADNLLNIDIGVDPDMQYSVISSHYMTTNNDTPASGVKSITAYGAGMAIGTRIKVWGIKK